MSNTNEYYNSIADKYDSIYDTEACKTEDRALVSTFLSRFADKKILDVGCGTGHLLELLDLPKDRYFGIDPSDKMLEVAKSKFPNHAFTIGQSETITEKQYQWAQIVYYGYGAASYSDLSIIITKFLVNATVGAGLFAMLYSKNAPVRIESNPKRYSTDEIKAVIPDGVSYSITPFMNNDFLNGGDFACNEKNCYWYVLKVYKEETGQDVTEQEMRDFIEQNKWRNAKTYESFAPHEYVVKNNLSIEQQRQFERVVMYIRKNGYREKFMGKWYVCYNVNAHKYWTMGAPLYQTIILNRAKLKP